MRQTKYNCVISGREKLSSMPVGGAAAVGAAAAPAAAAPVEEKKGTFISSLILKV